MSDGLRSTRASPTFTGTTSNCYYRRGEDMISTSAISTSYPSLSYSSGAYGRARGLSRLMLFFFFVMTVFTSSVHAQSPQQILTNIEQSAPSIIRPILPNLEQIICQAAATQLQNGLIQYGNPEFWAIIIELRVICMETVWELEIATGIAEVAALGGEFGEGALLWIDLQQCSHIVNQLLLPGPAAAENMACSQVLSGLHSPSPSVPTPVVSPSIMPTPATCRNPNAAQICQTQGCCDFDCDNLPPGFTQSGTNGVTCPMVATQRCCLGTNGCGYYCSTPPPATHPSPPGTDCACVGRICENAITSVSSATDCGANCYMQCIANALGGVCTDTADAASVGPIIVYTPACNTEPQGVCNIPFAQPDVSQCQTTAPSPPSTTTCPTAPGPIGPAGCGSLPGVQNYVDCLLQANVKVPFSGSSGDQIYCTLVESYLCGQTTFPDAGTLCNQCRSGAISSIDGSCFNTYFDVANQPLCAEIPPSCPSAAFG